MSWCCGAPAGLEAAKQPLSTETTTVEEVLKQQGFGRFQKLLFFVIGVGWMADGMEMYVMSLVVPVLPESWHMTAFDRGFIGGAVFVGMGLGAATFGPVADNYGRKGVLIACLGIATLFGFTSASAGGFGALAALRTIFGFGIGGFMPISTTMFTETTAEAMVAPVIGTAGNFFTIGGVILSLLAIWVLPHQGWEYLIIYSAIPLVPAFFALFLIVESPTWLLSKGRDEEAHAALSRMSRINGMPPPPPLRPMTKDAVPSYSAQLRILWKHHRAVMLVMCVQWFVISWVYYGAIYVLPAILKRRTTSEYTGILLTAVAEFPGNMGAGYLSNAIGRKPTFMVAFSICGFGALMTGIAADNWGTGWINFWSVIFKIGSAASFTTCYIYTSEAFPTTLRATSLGLCQIFARGAGAATPVVAQIMLADTSNFDTFLVYAVVSLSAVGVAALLPFDTRGRNADAIEQARVASETSPLMAPKLTKAQNV